MESNQKLENLVTWFFMFAAFMSVLAWGSLTLGFEESCKNACYPEASITPLYNFEHTCFCSEGVGKWRKENVR
jgi:hypothetical protein